MSDNVIGILDWKIKRAMKIKVNIKRFGSRLTKKGLDRLQKELNK